MDKIVATFSDFDLYNIFNEDIDVVLLQYSVQMKLNNNLISLTIIQGKNVKYKIENIFDCLMSLIFVAIGRHLKLESYCKNNVVENINDFTNQFYTSPTYSKSYFRFCNINKELLTEKNLEKILEFKAKNASLNSLQYLVCKKYDDLLWEHKLELLMHVLDGITNNFNLNIDLLKTQFEMEYSRYIKGNEPGEFICKLNYIFSKYYFIYDEVSTATIKLLKRNSKYSFLQGLEQSRNWYSHLPDINECSSKLNMANTDNISVIIIVTCVARLLLLDDYLHLHLNNKNIREAFACIHDWILDTSPKRKYKIEDLLSNTYKLCYLSKL